MEKRDCILPEQQILIQSIKVAWNTFGAYYIVFVICTNAPGKVMFIVQCSLPLDACLAIDSPLALLFVNFV